MSVEHERTLANSLRDVLQEFISADALWLPQSYAPRVAALDRLELALLGSDDVPPETTPGSPASDSGTANRAAGALLRQAAAVRFRLETANRVLVQDIRADIRSGTCRGPAARALLERLGGSPDATLASPDGAYTLLDSLVSDLLLDGEAPDPTLPLAPDSVAYQPTPARVVLEFLDRVPLGPADLVYDLGSGLGHVCLLVRWLTGAQARGIEIDPAYCSYARQQARALNISGVDFVAGDAATTSIAGGTCYFMYTPFTGRTLARVLDRLAGEARTRSIVVAAYGPCVAGLALQPWLAPFDDADSSGLAVFRSR